MTLIQEFKTTFKRLTPIQVVANELVDAELALLNAETGVEYASALVTYNKARIKRLKTYLAVMSKEKTK
jgi:hypothetical protein